MKKTDSKPLLAKTKTVLKKKAAISRLVKPNNLPNDVWKTIEKVLLASIHENTRARRWKIFFRFVWLIVFIGIIFSILNVTHNPKGYSSQWREQDTDHIALIRLEGVVAANLGGGIKSIDTERVVKSLERAYKNEKVKAIILSINSPGGSPVVAADIYDEIIHFKSVNPDKKIYSVIKDLGASAAYYIASSTDEIYSSKNSLVGSIGIISGGFGFDRAIQELGIDRRLYTAGDNKGFLDPFTAPNREHEEFWQELLERLHENFIEDVKAGRGGRISDNQEVFSGYIYDGQRALELGLIDGFGSVRSVALTKNNLEEIVDYTQQDNPLDILTNRLGGSIARSVWQIIATPSLQ